MMSSDLHQEMKELTGLGVIDSWETAVRRAWQIVSSEWDFRRVLR